MPCKKCNTVIENNLKQLMYENEGYCSNCGDKFNLSSNTYSTKLKNIFTQVSGQEFYPKLKKATRVLNLDMNRYPGGVSLMTCCRAILWQSELIEEDGIHVHAYDREKIRLDSTVGAVNIDGVLITPEMMKTFTLQKLLNISVETTKCSACGKPHFDKGEFALNPAKMKVCDFCHSLTETSGKSANPLIEIINNLSIKYGVKESHNE